MLVLGAIEHRGAGMLKVRAPGIKRSERSEHLCLNPLLVTQWSQESRKPSASRGAQWTANFVNMPSDLRKDSYVSKVRRTTDSALCEFNSPHAHSVLRAGDAHAAVVAVNSEDTRRPAVDRDAADG
jgi:hypothetical protein